MASRNGVEILSNVWQLGAYGQGESLLFFLKKRVKVCLMKCKSPSEDEI